MPPLDLSIVLVSHNHARTVPGCLASLYSLPDAATFETLLIENIAAGTAAAWVQGHCPAVQIVLNPRPQGFATNVNAGLRALRGGRHFLLLNPDVVCLPGLLDRLVAFMDAHPRTGVAAPQLLDADGGLQANCRRFPTAGALALRALHLDGIWRNHAGLRRYLMAGRDPARAAEVDWVTGAAAIVRRAAAEQVGLLDERYFLYWEDADWCYRMWEAGWTVCHVPEARAIHGHQRAGVRRPLSRAGFEQIAGAVRFFARFGWKPSRPCSGRAARAA